MQHDPIGLHGDRVGLGGERLGRLDGDLVGADAGAVGLADGAAGGEGELPAVPRTAEDLAAARPQVLAGGGGKRHAFNAAQAEWAALVRAGVAQRVEAVVDVEDADGAAFDLYDLAFTGWDLPDAADDVTGHHSISKSSATRQRKPGRRSSPANSSCASYSVVSPGER